MPHLHDGLVDVEQVLAVRATAIDLHHLAGDVGRAHDLMRGDDLVFEHLQHRVVAQRLRHKLG